jgi:hypothetical protein
VCARGARGGLETFKLHTNRAWNGKTLPDEVISFKKADAGSPSSVTQNTSKLPQSLYDAVYCIGQGKTIGT